MKKFFKKLFKIQPTLNEEIERLIKQALQDRKQAWHDSHANELEAIRWFVAFQNALAHGGEMSTREFAEMYLYGIKPVSYKWKDIVDELMDLWMIGDLTGDAQVREIVNLINEIKLFY